MTCFYTPVWKTDILCSGNVRPSIRWKKIKKNHHHYNTILSLYNIISRHYKKSLLRSQIYHGYEQLSTDTNYPIWRRQERRSKYMYAVQLASWQLRSNSPKTSVRPSVHLASPDTYIKCAIQTSVRPSTRPDLHHVVGLFILRDVRLSFPDSFSTCFEISFLNLVYTFSRWHDMSRLSFIIIGSLWPSLQPKVGQTHFLQSWTHKSR